MVRIEELDLCWSCSSAEARSKDGRCYPCYDATKSVEQKQKEEEAAAKAAEASAE